MPPTPSTRFAERHGPCISRSKATKEYRLKSSDWARIVPVSEMSNPFGSGTSAQYNIKDIILYSQEHGKWLPEGAEADLASILATPPIQLAIKHGKRILKTKAKSIYHVTDKDLAKISPIAITQNSRNASNVTTYYNQCDVERLAQAKIYPASSTSTPQSSPASSRRTTSRSAAASSIASSPLFPDRPRQPIATPVDLDSDSEESVVML